MTPTRGEPGAGNASMARTADNTPTDARLAGAAPFVPFARTMATRNWGWFAFRGVLLIALGIVALLLPGPTLFAAALVFAAFSFADGVASILAGVRGARNNRDRWWALVLSGLLGIAIGVAFLFFPFVGTLALSLTAIVMLAGYSIATGMLQMWAAWRLRREIEGEWLMMAAGVLSVLLGIALIALLIFAPAPTILVLAWMIGIWAAASGVTLLVLAFRLRKMRDSDGAAG